MAHALAQHWNIPQLTGIVNDFLGTFRATKKSHRPRLDVDLERVSISYDNERDVLYLMFEESEATDTYEQDGVIMFVRKGMFRRDPLLLGLTIMDASERPQVQQLIELIGRTNQGD